MRAHFELWTPRGAGGVAVVAVRGPDREVAVGKVLRTADGAPFVCVEDELRCAMVRIDGEVIDRAVVVTRADRIEIHVHGSEAVLGRMHAMSGPWREPAASPAQELAQNALSDEQLALALEQVEADWEGFVSALARAPSAERRRRVDEALARSCSALALAEPARVVLCGAQNAGKSTLLNRLLFRERALTGARAGLTRDPVRETTTLAGYPYVLIDTAGEGAVDGDLDRSAVARGRRERAGALRLVVVDGSVGPGAIEQRLSGPGALLVRNKIDLAMAPWPAGLGAMIELSCRDEARAPRIRQLVGEGLRALRGLPPAGPVGGPAALDRRQLAELEQL